MSRIQQILREEYKKRQALNPQFSMRSFARWLKVSPAQLSQMISGKRPITVKTMQKIVDRLGFSPLEKRRILHSVVEIPKSQVSQENTSTHLLAEDQFRMISDWYHLAILSLTRLKAASSDPRWIARSLGISVTQASEAVLRLVRLKLLQTTPQFQQVSAPVYVTSGDPSASIRSYHKQMLSLAMEKIETVPNSEREFQSIVFAMKPSQLGDLKKMIDEFLEQASHSVEGSRPSQVYALNVQLIPLSQKSQEHS